MPAHKTGKKGRKIGGNKEFCLEYRKQCRSEKNKALKRARHLKAHPTDTGNTKTPNYTRKKPLDYFEKNLQKPLDKRFGTC